ncbi:MAG TPA: DUF1810 family protein [Vicinamibacterales bacterium]|nr:DUF1810 family protein [Vicinamibacterales bacterium]
MPHEGLDRFVEAQSHQTSGFDAALLELRTGGKRGHWIWYIFPQLSGLGASWMAQHYEIRGVDEATSYLTHPVLGPRLLELTRIVREQVRQGANVRDLMGSRIDALKLVSSLTLFRGVASRVAADHECAVCVELAVAAGEVLATAELQGYPPCQFTLAALERT